MASRRNTRLFSKLTLSTRTPSPMPSIGTPEAIIRRQFSHSRAHSRNSSIGSSQQLNQTAKTSHKKSRSIRLSKLEASPPKSPSKRMDGSLKFPNQRRAVSRYVSLRKRFSLKQTPKRPKSQLFKYVIPNPPKDASMLATSVSNSISFAGSKSTSFRRKRSYRIRPSLRQDTSFTPDVKLRYTPDLPANSPMPDYFPSYISSLGTSPKVAQTEKQAVWKELSTTTPHRNTVTCLALAQGFAVSGSADYSVAFTSLDGRYPVRRITSHKRRVNCLSVVEKVVCSASSDASIRLWKNQEAFHTFPNAHKGGVNTVCSPMAASLLSGGSDGSIVLWDLNQTARIETSQDVHGGASVTALASCAVFMYASGSQNGEVALWDIRSGSSVATAGNVGASKVSVICSATERQIVTGDTLGCVRTWDLRDLSSPAKCQSFTGPIYDLCQFEGATLLACANSSLHSLSDTTRPLPPVVTNGSLRCLAARSDIIACGSHDKTVSIWRCK